MLIRKPTDIPSSEITPESVYINRRRFIGKGAGITLGAAAGGTLISGGVGGALAGGPGGAAAQTLLFNGYVDQVAGLYAGMDLRVYY